jgi:hypothetical protein
VKQISVILIYINVVQAQINFNSFAMPDPAECSKTFTVVINVPKHISKWFVKQLFRQREIKWNGQLKYSLFETGTVILGF